MFKTETSHKISGVRLNKSLLFSLIKQLYIITITIIKKVIETITEV